jgi:rod shape-determining protein MreC
LTGKRPFYFLAFALAPLLLFLQAPERAEIIHQVSLTLMEPLLVASHTVQRAFIETGEGIHTFWVLYRSHGKLVERVESLERDLVETAELKKENERLRGLIKFKNELPGKVIPARVVGRDLAPWRKTIVIDKGSTHGVAKRMAVVSARGLVGRVVEVAPFASRVILLVDPESRVSTLFQESRDSGIVEGDSSSWLRVTHIDRESSVKVGDRVISSGLGRVYPKGIPIGQVEMVGTEKEGLELFATVRPFVNFSKLEEVLCVALSPRDS